MKISVSILLLVLTISCYGQFEAGGTMIGGNMSVNSTSYDVTGSPSQTSVVLESKVLFLATNNFALGGLVNMQSVSVSGQSSKASAFGPVARFYFESGIYPQISYEFYKVSQFGSSDFDAKILDLSLGYAAFLGEHVALEPELYYQKWTVINSYNIKQLGFRIGLMIYLD